MPIRYHRSAALILSCVAACGQTAKPPAIPANYDETLAAGYTLPDPLILANGKKVRDAATWNKQRRPEILQLFETNMHGRSPGRPPGMTFDVFDKGTPALDGKALRRQVTVYFSADKAGPKMDVALYLPAAARKPSPVLLCLNFSANSNTIDDPVLKAGEVWSRERKKVPASSGRSFGKLKLDNFLAQGFGVAAIYCGDIEPDFPGGAPYGVRGLFLKPGQTEPAPDESSLKAAHNCTGYAKTPKTRTQVSIDTRFRMSQTLPTG